MKILVVDDEVLVRIGIKSCVAQEERMEIVGEAGDGEKAMELVEQTHPDVILLDIKMPRMDGLAFMRQMNQKQLECKVIMLSSFDDFEYVKEAMKLGAVDYLHKPRMTSEDILQILRNIKQQIDEEKASVHEEQNAADDVKHDRHVPKDVFLKQWVDGQIRFDADFQSVCRENGVALHNKRFYCMVFSVRDYKKVRKRYANSNQNLLQSSIGNIMNEVLAMEDGTEYFIYDENLHVVITSSNESVSERKIMEKVHEISHVILDAVHQFLDIDITVGISDICNAYDEIHDAFLQASKALEHKFYQQDKNVIYYRDIKINRGKEALNHVNVLTNQLKTCLTSRNGKEFNKVLEELIGYLQREACLSEQKVKKLLSGFLFLIEESQQWLSEIEVINNCETLGELYEVYTDFIRQWTEDGQCSAEYRGNNYLIQKILQIVENEYHRDITLQYLSEQLNVSPNYISRLFKKETGKGLFEYINEVRIREAKKMLENETLKIYEVGYEVGFKSPVHFNIVFNKLTGMSPKQYRSNRKV